MCKNKSELNTLYVKDALAPTVKKLCAFDSMRKVGALFAAGAAAIPIVDYSGKLVGSLDEKAAILFLNSYFENLKSEDRGNEFLYEKESDLNIHFVPIDQITRYMHAITEDNPQLLTVDQTLDEAEALLCEQSRTAGLVYDGDEIVGSVSLSGIAFARHRSKMTCCQKCRSNVENTKDVIDMS